MKTHWILPCFALSLLACSGSPPAERSQAESQATAPLRPAPAVPAASPSPEKPAGGPELSWAALDPKMEGELPVRWTPVFSGAPRTRLEAGTLWAPAAPVVRVFAPKATVGFQGGSLEIDGRPSDVPARLVDGEPWAAVVPLARRFGAYARVHAEDGSISIWPREVLTWLVEHGDPKAPVLREARDAGLLGPAG